MYGMLPYGDYADFAGAPTRSIPPEFPSPKRARKSLPPEQYAVRYADGKVSFLTKGAWEKLRAKVAEVGWSETMPQSVRGIENKPRFFVGVFTWWHYFDDDTWETDEVRS